MSQKLLLNPRVWGVFLSIDRDLAERTRARGCPCGGALHVAWFERKPRGAVGLDDPEFRVRFSFCCDQDGCRQRATPPSVRFLGRRVFLGAVVVLLSALRQAPTPTRMNELVRHFRVDVRTVQRWQLFWKEAFPVSRCGRLLRARLPGLEGLLPLALFDRIGDSGEEDALVTAMRQFAQISQSPHLPDLVC